MVYQNNNLAKPIANKPKKYLPLTPLNENYGIVSAADLKLVILNKFTSNFTYGAELGIETSALSARLSPSFIYLESPFGKIEAGSNSGAAKKMTITASNIACDSKFALSAYAKLNLTDNNIKYFSSFTSFIDTKMRGMKKTEFSRKISYYTPKIKGFQIGLSYAPISTNHGSYSLSKPKHNFKINLPILYKDRVIKNMDFNTDLHNMFSTGISYSYQNSSDLKLQLAAVYEQGETKVEFAKNHDVSILNGTDTESFITTERSLVIYPKNTSISLDINENGELKNLPDQATVISADKLKNLMSYTIGGVISYKDFSIAAGYSDNLSSFLPTTYHTESFPSYMYNIGIRYIKNNLGFSIIHFSSNYYNNLLYAFTIGTSYKIRNGLLSYIEITKYSTEGHYIDKKDAKDKFEETNGSIFALGLRINI